MRMGQDLGAAPLLAYVLDSVEAWVWTPSSCARLRERTCWLHVLLLSENVRFFPFQLILVDPKFPPHDARYRVSTRLPLVGRVRSDIWTAEIGRKIDIFDHSLICFNHGLDFLTEKKHGDTDDTLNGSF